MPDYVAKFHKFIVKEIQREVAKASRTSGLAQSTIVNGAIGVADVDGNVVARVGTQPDGTHGVVTVDGPTPPAPAGCTAEGGQLSVTATTVGLFVDGAPAPLDFDATEVHASTDAAFETSAATRTGTITSAEGASLTFGAAAGALYVRFITRAKSGKLSEATDPVEVQVTAAVDPEIFEQLHQDLADADGRLATAEQDLADAKSDLYDPTGRVQVIKNSLDSSMSQLRSAVDIARQAGANLAPDPGFDSLTPPNGSAVFDFSIKHSGRASIKRASLTGALSVTLAQQAPTQEGRVWYFSAWMRSATTFVDPQDDFTGAVFITQPSGAMTHLAPPPPDGAWRNVEAKVTVPAGDTQITAILYEGSTTGGLNFDDVVVADITAAQQAQQTADAAQTTASGKNQILSGTTDPVGNGKAAGDRWQKYTLANNIMRIVAVWRWSGSKWEPEALDETYIPQVNIGTGTYGELDGLRLKAKSVQANTVVVEGSVGTVLLADGAVTAQKLNVQSVTAAVAAIIQLDVSQLTVTGTSSFAAAVVDKMWANIFAAHEITADEVNAASVAAAVGSFVKVNAENVLAGNVVAPLIVAPGGKVVAGDPAGANASMESDGFHTYAVGPDGDQYESSRMGSSDGADYQELRPGPGLPPVYSVSPRGDVTANSVTSQGDITVGGMPLLGTLLGPAEPPGVLDGFSRGAVQLVNFQPKLSTTISDGATVAVAMAAVNIAPGRIYQVSLPWKVNITPSSSTGSTSNVPYSVRLHYEIGPQGNTPDPTQSSTMFMYTNQRSLPVASNYDGVLATTFASPAGTEPLRIKMLLVFSVVRGSLTPDLAMPLNWIATATDIGSAANAQIITASSPGSAAVSTFTSTWRATNSRSWNTDGVVYHPDGTTTGAIRQGLVNGKQWFGAFSCGGNATSGETDKTIGQALAGASVVKAMVRVQLTWSPPNADYKSQIKMRPLGANSVPSTLATPTGASPVTADFPGNVGLWIPVPTNWFTASNNGVIIAAPDWLFPNTNCVFAGATAPANQQPMVELTYTR